MQSKENAELRHQAERLLARAAELTNLKAPGAPRFLLRARFRFFDQHGTPAEGAYALLWTAPARFREEVRLGSFTQLRITEDDKLWEKRNLPYLPLGAWEVMSALSSAQRHPLGQPETVDKVEQHQDGKTCLKTKVHGHYVRTICLAVAIGVVIQETRSDNLRWEYTDYRAFGARLFPRRLSSFDGDRRMLDVEIEELAEVREVDAALLTPPPEASVRPWCAEPQPPGPPPSARSPLEYPVGDFYVHAVIGTDGRLQKLKILQSSGDWAMDQAQLSHMRGEKWRPAFCGTVPIEVEQVFRIRGH